MTTDGDAGGPALVFTIAMNGYRWAWRSCLRSHRRYAARLGFDRACVDLPWTVTPAEAAWLKLRLLARALEDRRYAWLLFLDADAEVRPGCPDFRAVAVPGRDVYMAHGHSGRLNSGVIAVRRSDASRAFLRRILADCDGPVAPEDAAPYENGHVIKHGKADPVVGLLDRRWNNTVEPALGDHVRHFTGPMRAHGRVDRATAARWRRAAAVRERLAAVWTPPPPDGPLRERLDRLADAVAARYAVFG